MAAKTAPWMNTDRRASRVTRAGQSRESFRLTFSFGFWFMALLLWGLYRPG